jgi:hypothetical protein
MNETTTHETASRPRSGATIRPTLLAGGVLVAALVVIVIGVVDLNEGRRDATYPADSPEAAFQAYVRDWTSGEVDAAWAMVSASARERISAERFRSANLRRSDEPWRVWIDDSAIESDRAVLYLSLESIVDDGLLGRDRIRESRRMTLVREDGRWVIDTPSIVFYW